MNTPKESIQSLHKAYQTYTGLELSLDMHRERCWFDFRERGLTSEDIRIVTGYLRAQIKIQKRNPGCLKFSNMIGNIDYFEEDLAMARAQARNTKPWTDRESVLSITGRPERILTEAKAAGAIVAKLKSDPAAAAQAFQELQQLKHSL